MTERLYLSDPYLTSFRARVVEMRELDGKPAAVLDKSAFYPEGGGQPGDRGRLGGAQVIDTQERQGEVLHLVDKPVSGEVEAEIDWVRRFDHMQQHHGQHLLSAAFDKLEAPTVSFHLGERTCTIDLDAPLGKLDLRAAEAMANDSIWRDLPVIARDFTGEERAKLPLRKEPVKGDRVVLVEGVDASPCGGTHPRRTGEVGCVAILKAQRWGEGKARIEFACGNRVVRLLREANETVQQAADALKAAPADLAQAAARVAKDAYDRRKALEAAQADLAKLEAAQLMTKPGPVVAKVERGAAFARAIAQAISSQGRIALIASIEDGRAHLCFARPKGEGAAMGALLKEALAVLGGKGGGNPDFAQGSGDPGRLDEALALAARKI
ncbi:MAG: DHHA1 domain-containing protein [Myxococcales bacterium]